MDTRRPLTSQSGSETGKVTAVITGIRGRWRAALMLILAVGATLVLGGCFEAFKQPFQNTNWTTTITVPLIERTSANGYEIRLDGTANRNGEKGTDFTGKSLLDLTVPEQPVSFYSDITVGSGVTIPPGVDVATLLGSFPPTEQEVPFMEGISLRSGSMTFSDVKLPDNLRLVLTVTLTALDAGGATVGTPGLGTANLEKSATASIVFDGFFQGLAAAGVSASKIKVSTEGSFERVDPNQSVVVQPDQGKTTASLGAAVQFQVSVEKLSLPAKEAPVSLPGPVTRIEGGTLAFAFNNQSALALDVTLIVSDSLAYQNQPDPTGTHRVVWSIPIRAHEQTKPELTLGSNELALFTKSPLYIGFELVNAAAPGAGAGIIEAGDYLEVTAYGKLVAQVRKLIGGGAQ